MLGRPVSADPGPGTYRMVFDRIAAHRAQPLTVTVASLDDLITAIREYATFYSKTDEVTVGLEPIPEYRSIGSGWITTGGRDAGSFTWRPVRTVTPDAIVGDMTQPRLSA